MGRMRRVLLAATLAGCAPHQATGPAWPKAAASESDGGESLTPHESKQVTVAIEKSDDDVKPAATPAAPVAPVAAPETVAPVIAPAATLPVEETITTEDIIIEIDD